jgi:hypothetical protein
VCIDVSFHLTYSIGACMEIGEVLRWTAWHHYQDDGQHRPGGRSGNDRIRRNPMRTSR